MAGSAFNKSGRAILAGMALHENSDGTVTLADGNHPASFLAAEGGTPGGMIQLAEDGVIIRQDWSLISGLPNLSPGQQYFVALSGRLSKSGSQSIGTAINRTTLRLNLSPPQKSYSQMLAGTGTPSNSIGSLGDSFIDTHLGAIWTKNPNGWTLTGRLIKPLVEDAARPIYAEPTQFGWSLFS